MSGKHILLLLPSPRRYLHIDPNLNPHQEELTAHSAHRVGNTRAFPAVLASWELAHPSWWEGDGLLGPSGGGANTRDMQGASDLLQ